MLVFQRHLLDLIVSNIHHLHISFQFLICTSSYLNSSIKNTPSTMVLFHNSFVLGTILAFLGALWHFCRIHYVGLLIGLLGNSTLGLNKLEITTVPRDSATSSTSLEVCIGIGIMGSVSPVLPSGRSTFGPLNHHILAPSQESYIY